MAYTTESVGKYSELIARAALLANGWSAVSTSETEESFDVSARDPLTGDWKTFQVKTIRKRDDRRGELVIYARNGQGKAYSQSDADYIIGVLGENGEMPRVWLLENRGLQEYWATEARASQRWVELSIALDRGVFEATSA
ncbi:hypothetical protein [Cytobacillus purgationiresistens]|uniref:DUF4365 domain-containing protein n=1 Tax=Cytobacillus purgationiresistens TaxID=863449 RepID=A0ABU0AJ77_9BACI|nr:hypothetical protein [Cytobacillus purgationiresistens]MDQ0270771.1 hypothetical protein [Cytobacillus purgationiresistens]